ncbi:MAG: HAD-IIB family hydrolase [Deltaproteobacteria bacterium]|nr:HAD-IIB family hydrolase [Deltaproteobacteria bacterium]
MEPSPLRLLPPSAWRGITALLFDVDDTLTTDGALLPDAYRALWAARAAGLWTCAVTGRGAGWCDLMVRLFPVDAVVGETGAFVYEKLPDGRIREAFLRSAAQRRDDDRRRWRAVAAVQKRFPEARIARDTAFRLCDTALDLKEDGPPVADADARAMMALLQARGLTVARSSVHINAWVGDYGKREMVQALLARRRIRRDRAVYVGDSRNDGPLFAFFPHSVGVANVAPLLDELRARSEAPRWITRRRGGLGFAEVVRTLGAHRRGRA